MSRSIHPAVAFIEQLSMALGLSSFVTWIYLSLTDDSRRLGLRYLHPNPLLKLELFLFAITLLRNTIPRRYTIKNHFAAFMCFFFTFILVVAIFLYTCFVLMITNKTEAREVPGRAYKEYNSTDGYSGYSSWFMPYGSSRRYTMLKRISKSLSHSGLCENFDIQCKNQTASEFYKNRLSPIQSGCCIPPSNCPNLEYRSSNFWYFNLSAELDRLDREWAEIVEQGKNTLPLHILLKSYGKPQPCHWWSNNLTHRCYWCNTCLSAVHDNIRMEWRLLAILNMFVLCITILFSISQYATRDMQLEFKCNENP